MTDHQTATRMLKDGFRNCEIMRKTGMSKSAVAGLAYRLRAKADPSEEKPVARSREPHIVFVSRERDEEVLLWIRRRRSGMPVGEIALRSATGAGQVSMAVELVRKADLAESGEDPVAVARCYWKTHPALGRSRRGRGGK